jgi:hypothetical protein
MEKRVLGSANDFQILETIVSRVTIEVMDLLPAVC